MSVDNKEQLYQQETEFDILSVLIPHIQHKIFVDIGAEKGETAKFMMQQGLDGYLFEPLPKHHSALEKLVSHTDSVFYPYAIDDHNHTGILNIATDKNNQELDYFHSLQRMEGDERVRHNKQLSVECFSIDSLVEQGLISAQVGLLKTDTEGNDLNVIVGMGGLQPDVLMCEFFTEGVYSGWEDAHPEKLIAAAREKGYNHYIAIKRRDGLEMVSISPTPFTEKEWGNLIFMKQDIYVKVCDALLLIAQGCERKMFDEVDVYRKACAERLELINQLTGSSPEIGSQSVRVILARLKKWLRKSS